MNPKLQNCELLAADIGSSDEKWMGSMATVLLGQPVEEGSIKTLRRRTDGYKGGTSTPDGQTAH